MTLGLWTPWYILYFKTCSLLIHVITIWLISMIVWRPSNQIKNIILKESRDEYKILYNNKRHAIWSIRRTVGRLYYEITWKEYKLKINDSCVFFLLLNLYWHKKISRARLFSMISPGYRPLREENIRNLGSLQSIISAINNTNDESERSSFNGEIG